MKTIEELKAIIQAGKDAEMELEERGRVKFREVEWVKNEKTMAAMRYNPRYTFAEWRNFSKFTLEDIVKMMAPPEAVRWDMDNECDVFFLNENGVCIADMTVPDHMARDDWKKCGGPL